MLNRSEVMTAAWKAYRLARPAFFAAGDNGDKRMFLRPLFGRLLRSAWDDARMVELTAAAFVAAEARVNATKAAALPEGERSARVSKLRDELLVLDCAPLGVRAATRRQHTNAELAALSA